MSQQIAEAAIAEQDEPQVVLSPVDAATAVREVVEEKLADVQTPGFQAEFDPDEAELAGAFVEDALSAQDAAESSSDLPDADDAVEPTFVLEGETVTGLPAFVDVGNVVSLYGWQPGESLVEAIARTRKEQQEG